MSKLRIEENVVVSCPTKEDAVKLLEAFNAMGLTWCSGTAYDPGNTKWHYHKESTFYNPHKGTYGSRGYANDTYTYISVGLFIKLHKMNTRKVELTLEKAKEWYKKGGDLKEVALQAFTEEELKEQSFRDIKTFEDACYAVMLHPYTEGKLIETIEGVSKASAAAYKLNIIRKALNKGQKMDFKKGEIWYPNTYLVLSNNNFHKSYCETEIARVKIDCDTFILLSGSASVDSHKGLGNFIPDYNTAMSYSVGNFLGCATKEIAQHMGEHFAKLIFEAKYGDTVNYEWV